VRHHHDVRTKRKCCEAFHRCLDAHVESAQWLPAREGTEAPVPPQLDFARPASSYFGHSETVPFTDVVLAQGRYEGDRPVVTELFGD